MNNNEKYIIFKREGTSSKKYLTTIYRNSISTSSDIGDALEFNNKDLAVDLAEILGKRERETLYVLSVVTTTTVIGEEMTDE